MAQRKADIAIGERAYSEVMRLYGSSANATKALGCTRRLINDWNWGVAPSALYLARMHELGIDIVYILTGRNNNAQN